ncbi:unnamed protein product [Brassica oleracea]
MTFTYRLVEDELPLAVIDKKNGKREVVLQEDDWKDLEIKMISELFVANQVLMLEGNSQNESEECITPFPKRKVRHQKSCAPPSKWKRRRKNNSAVI